MIFITDVTIRSTKVCSICQKISFDIRYVFIKFVKNLISSYPFIIADLPKEDWLRGKENQTLMKMSWRHSKMLLKEQRRKIYPKSVFWNV